MHKVIGTAGHVDHGKSSLIQALTGIHPSHLPEELRRNMTIDLGFSYFKEGEYTIGVIDVPGHERFIRNMVSALWGLDLVLFVVAADEGWSSLSREHLKILSALDKKKCILVITKKDLVSDEVLASVENRALEEFLEIMGILPEVVAVSALNNVNIDRLKTEIIHSLNEVEKADNLTDDAHLYIDRVFSVSGIGTTVTGTLRGADLAEDDVLTLLPQGQKVKIRSIQSYHEPCEKAQTYSRVALGLKSVDKKLVKRGFALVKNDKDAICSDEWIIKLNPLLTHFNKKQSVVEVALGTSSTLAKCFLYNNGLLARLQLKEIIPAFWGQKILLMQHGGSELIGSGELIWGGELHKSQRKTFESIAETLDMEGSKINERLKLDLAIKGYAKIESNHQNITFEKIQNYWINPTIIAEKLITLDNVLGESMNAVTLNELSRKIEMPLDLTENLVAKRVNEGIYQRIKNGIVLSLSHNLDELPKNQIELLSTIEMCGDKGFESEKSRQVGINRLLRALTEKDLIVPTENGLFFTREIYDELVRKIMLNRTIDEEFTVADARERVDLSRKQILPLLNKMEKEGYVRRIENNRKVIRLLNE